MAAPGAADEREAMERTVLIILPELLMMVIVCSRGILESVAIQAENRRSGLGGGSWLLAADKLKLRCQRAVVLPTLIWAMRRASIALLSTCRDVAFR